MMKISYLYMFIMVMFGQQVLAHHVLGRPAYSLNENSNTPPSMNIETQIGDYFVTAMVFPAFPKPNEPGRINLYATHLDTGIPLNTDVTFSVKDDGWGNANEEQIGAQVLDDSVYRQGFQFSQNGKYVITASFEANGEPYSIDFPLQVGIPDPIGPLGFAIGGLLFVLIGVSVVQRKKLMRAKFQASRDEQ